MFAMDNSKLSKYLFIVSVGTVARLLFTLSARRLVKLLFLMKLFSQSWPGKLFVNLLSITRRKSKYLLTREDMSASVSGTFQSVRCFTASRMSFVHSSKSCGGQPTVFGCNPLNFYCNVSNGTLYFFEAFLIDTFFC